MPQDLPEARRLLGEFEKRTENPESLLYLSGALSLLADIAMDATSADVKQTCSNTVSTYAREVLPRVQPLFTQEDRDHDYWETVDHWLRVFNEFKDSEFPLPSEVTECQGELAWRKCQFLISQMSFSQLQRLSQLIQSRLGE